MTTCSAREISVCFGNRFGFGKIEAQKSDFLIFLRPSKKPKKKREISAYFRPSNIRAER